MTFVDPQTPLEVICSLATQLELLPAARRSDGLDALLLELANLTYAVAGVRGAARCPGGMAPDRATRAALARDLGAASGHLRALLWNTELAARTGEAGAQPLLRAISGWGTALARTLATAGPPAIGPEGVAGWWPQRTAGPSAWPSPLTTDAIPASLHLVDMEGTLTPGDEAVDLLCHFTTRLRLMPEAPILRGLDLFAPAVAGLARSQYGSKGALRRALTGEWTPEVPAVMVLGYHAAADGVYGLRALLEPLARSAGPEARAVVCAIRDLLSGQEKVLARTRGLTETLLGPDAWAAVSHAVVQARRARLAPYIAPLLLGGEQEDTPPPVVAAGNIT